MSQALTTRIRADLDRTGLCLPESVALRLADYLNLLVKWNRVYNLTAVRDETRMIGQHLLDSLVVLPHLGGPAALADVGSGAGLPGIPLAIACPAMAVTVIEANSKKASFLQQARIELQLDNVSVHCGRVEAYQPSSPFSVVISRAFSDLALYVDVAGHLLAPEGRLLAMKGLRPDEELAALPAGWQATRILPLNVPTLSAQRHLIVIQRP